MDDPDYKVEDVYRLNKDGSDYVRAIDHFGPQCIVWRGRNKARNFEDAVVRLGMNQSMDLIYALELPKTFKKCKAFDQVEFQKHSFAVALLVYPWLEKSSLILMPASQRA